ncbi:MAG: hypothetical protein RBU45_16505 [Myxococcota bacterium]|jgi:hypothetical protein|nr:hypothetical protein [Myxococcota bacterium]
MTAGRVFLLLVVAGGIGGSLLWLATARPTRESAFGPGSIHNPGARGLSLAASYLQARQHPAAELHVPLSRALPPPTAVVLRVLPRDEEPRGPEDAEPSSGRPARESDPPDAGAAEDPPDARIPTDAEASSPADGGPPAPPPVPPPVPPPEPVAGLLTPREAAWIAGGGRLVLAVERPYAQLEVVGDPVAASATLDKVYPRWPAVRRLEVPVRRWLAGPAAAHLHTLFAAGGQPVIARLLHGRGEVLLLACPELLTNQGLGAGDGVALLEALGRDEATGQARPLLFDETVHGVEARAGLLRLLGDWGFGPLLGLLVLAVVLAYWRQAVPLGPREDDYRERRRETVEGVDSLALLYRQTLSRADALELYRQAWQRTVATSSGLSGEPLQRRLAELGAGLALPSEPRPGGEATHREFTNGLAALNEAFRRLSHGRHR